MHTETESEVMVYTISSINLYSQMNVLKKKIVS